MVKRKRRKLKGRRKKQKGGDLETGASTGASTGRTDPRFWHSAPSNKPPPSYTAGQEKSKNKTNPIQMGKKLATVGGKIQQMASNESEFVGKILFLIGIITFIVGIFSNSMQTILIAYACMMGGVAMSFMMILISASRKSNSEEPLSLLKNIMPLVLPTLSLLGTLIVVVFIFSKAKNAFKSDGCDIPGIFNKFNYLTFMFLTIQIYLLNKFYNQYRKNMGKIKWAYVSGFILSSILTLVFSLELYTIVVSFLTDG